MPNTNSAKKRVRQDAQRALRNKARKTRARTQVRKVRKAVSMGDLDTAKAALPTAASTLDKAAQQGVIHRNKANRLKSRLAKKVNKA